MMTVTIPAAQQQQQQARYKVGCVDFELDDLIDGEGGGVAPSSSSTSSSPVDHSRHLVGSIYYPAAAVSADKAHRWSPTFYHTHSYVSFASRLSPDHGTALRKAKNVAFAAVSHGVLLAAGVRVAADAGRAAPPLKKKKDAEGKEEKGEEERIIPVVFSHGLGGSRAAYSAFAASLASAGFAVLAIEHADGTAAVAKLAGSRGWRDYERWQPDGEQLRARGEARRAELAAAARVWKVLARGSGGKRQEEALQGLSLEGGRVPLDFFVGAVDAAVAPAIVGHSFGGALAADAAAADARGAASSFSAAVSLDPWWGAVPADSKAGDLSTSSSASSSKAPLFVLGSDAWNTPNADGEIACGKEAQERILKSFASSSSSSPSSSSSSTKSKSNDNNNGALFAILKGSSHAGFSDVVSLLPGLSRWFYSRRRRKQATAAGAEEEVEGEEEASGSVVTEASDPISTARAAAEMTAAFLRRRAGKGRGEGGGKVTEDDRDAVLGAARSVGVELRGVRVV